MMEEVIKHKIHISAGYAQIMTDRKTIEQRQISRE